MNRRLTIALITLLIILLSIISFAGLFVQDTKFMKNLVPEYELGMDLEGYRAITVAVSDEKETIYYDAEGNVVTTEAEDGKSEEVPVNNEEDLTKENYEKAKDLIKARLKDLEIKEYLVRLDEESGSVTVQLPEDSMTDIASQFLTTTGEFTIEDAETGEVLLDNSNIKEAKVGYASASTGTSVYLSIEFNKDSKEKLREISTTYVTTTNEEGEETEKQVELKMDGSTMLSTSFADELADGILPINMGTATDNTTLNTYMQQASNIAILINNGPLPLEYESDQNRFIQSDLSLEDTIVPGIVLAVILVIGFIVLIIKYKKLGLAAIVSFIGYVAIVLLALRIFNIVITLEGICAIVASMLLNYILLAYLLNTLSKADTAEWKTAFNKAILSIIFVLVPVLIIGIVLCFAAWMPTFSFGTVTFWAILIMILYNISITKVLVLNSVKK
jgi:preprotein translocase subunit SecD